MIEKIEEYVNTMLCEDKIEYESVNVEDNIRFGFIETTVNIKGGEEEKAVRFTTRVKKETLEENYDTTIELMYITLFYLIHHPDKIVVDLK